LTHKRLWYLGLLTGLIGAVVLLGGCLPVADDGGETATGFDAIWPMLIFIVFLFGLMYFVMIRPQRKRQKEHQQLVEELQKGDQVVTAGGIYGRIESLDGPSVVLRIESGATIRIARTSVIGKPPEREAEVG
jgi:preprotein translocase subunit YajC